MIDVNETLPGYTPVKYTDCEQCALKKPCGEEGCDGPCFKACTKGGRSDRQEVMFIKNQKEPEMKETNWDKFSGNDSEDVVSAYEHHKPEYPECDNIIDWLRADYKEPKYQLPEWFAVGKWIGTVYGCSKFVRITAIHPKRPGEDKARFEVVNTKGDRAWWWIAKVYVDEGNFTPAKVVPWTPEEAKEHIGKALQQSESKLIADATIIAVRAKSRTEEWRAVMNDGWGHEFSRTLDELARNYILESGAPCGTLVKA